MDRLLWLVVGGFAGYIAGGYIESLLNELDKSSAKQKTAEGEA